LGVERKQVSFVVVSGDEAGQRLDNYLSGRLKGLPRSRIYSMMRKGEVRVNRGRAAASYRVKEGDEIRIPPVQVVERMVAGVPDELARKIRNAILYENKHFLVVDKPPGIAVHGGSGISFGVIEILRQGSDPETFYELVHRLDRDTSGCLLIAKSRTALKKLHASFRLKTVSKTYTALVNGAWPAGLTVVNAPLQTNRLISDERMVVASTAGKASKTEFKLLKNIGKFSLVQAMPITGRTHQIRVHARIAGHPICGDVKYGQAAVDQHLRNAGFKRLFLHASALTFEFEAEVFRIRSPLTSEWSDAIDFLGSGFQAG
jgi:23S rRNA pseudouridine955/2504/2580 synthase